MRIDRESYMEYKNDRLVMYLHGGSGNHGCEAIVNSTCHMTEGIPKLLVTNSEQEDRRYSVGALCDILQERKIAEHFFAHVWCYEVPRKEAMLAHSTFCRAGARTVLWGCSLEPELLENPAVVDDMKRYTLITPRESITEQALRDAGVVENVKRYPDPAFFLDPESFALPAGFRAGETIGMNISPMIVENETVQGITVANYRKLMAHILDSTTYSIALIPHVMWHHTDDRKTLAQLYETYADNDRVILFEDMSCQRLKYIISKCRAFIGARTHATIAAYSSMVPTLVVGYSVKARGIARDLFGTEEHYVLPVQSLSDPAELIGAYEWMMEREEEIRRRLTEIMPAYREEAGKAGEEIRKLWRAVQ